MSRKTRRKRGQEAATKSMGHEQSDGVDGERTRAEGMSNERGGNE